MKLTRRERVRLLVETIELVRDKQSEPSRGPLTSQLLRHDDLWYQGSYQEADACIERLKHTGYVKIYRHLREHYQAKNPKARKQCAERGLDLITQWMPRSVFVPLEVSLNGGFREGEAKTYTKPRRLAA